MLKFGSVTIDVSHPRTFAGILEEGERARYTAVFNDGFRSEEQTREFAERYGAKIYSSLDEMIDNIDLGLIHACNWDKHLDYAMHFVRRGKPVFIDKPLVGNLRDCERFLELCAQGARILGTSAVRFLPEIEAAKQKMRDGGVAPVHTVTTVGIDEYNYAIHAVELLLGINDSRPRTVRYLGTGAVEGGAESCESYFITFENGATASLHAQSKKYVPFRTIIMTSDPRNDSDISFEPDPLTLYRPLMDRICDSVESGENRLATPEETVDALRVLFAGRVSRNEGGTEISVDSEKLYDVKFDGYEFERGYAAAQKR